jgi:hypothetical protein
MKFSTIILLIFLNVTNAFAQNEAGDKAAYLKTITERAAKIVANLQLSDSVKKEKVTLVIRDQYRNLNEIYQTRDAHLKAIKEKYSDKQEREAALVKENTSVEAQLIKLHQQYLKKLTKQLTDQQIAQVKDGMTYGVLPLTYRAYQEQILTLTDDQKKQILIWLTEAREKAMDAESAEKKHAWFGKYKGRINNYLSAAGYDLKKEGIEWEKRRKAAQAN